MNKNKEQEDFTGLEPYRNPYQAAIGYSLDTEQYSDAQSQIYEELEADSSVGDMDQFHILGMLRRGQPRQSFDYLQYVLEDEL